MMGSIYKCTAIATAAIVLGAGAAYADPVQPYKEKSATTTQQLTQRRDQIEQMADQAIDRLTKQNKRANELYGQAYGYAVFDTTKGGLIVTGTGGTGVAQPKSGGERTFMRLGGAGVGVGAGLANYKLVFLFQDKDTYDRFINGKWDAKVTAQAAAGDKGSAATAQFTAGVATFRLTDGGLFANIDVSGMKFWPSDKLNPGAA
jgi:lipid-binding SYLF domain-containing protein